MHLGLGDDVKIAEHHVQSSVRQQVQAAGIQLNMLRLSRAVGCDWG